MKRFISVMFVILFAITFYSCSNKNSEVNLPKTIKLSTGDNLIVTKTYGDGFLGYVNTSYGPVYILKVKGNHYQMGYQYGRLAGDMIPGVWWTFLNYISGQADQVERGVNVGLGMVSYLFGKVLDVAWEHLSPYVPQEFKDEIKGIEDGAEAAGYKTSYQINGKFYSDPDLTFSTIIKRMIALSNISDISEDDFMKMLQTIVRGYSDKYGEYFGLPIESQYTAKYSSLADELNKAGFGNWVIPELFHHCSFFAAYNYLTKDGHMIASRNLDWSNGSGIAKFKMLTIWVPDNEIPHMTISYAGFIGAIAGMSEAGLGIGEVGSGSVLERLNGEPWVLKLREILEKAHNLDEAIKFVTNSVGDGVNRPPTIGYNWMVAYGDPENKGKNAEVANFENNGIFTGMYRRKPDCSVDAELFKFGPDGKLLQVLTHKDHPFLVNYEGQAVEIMLGNKEYPSQITSIPSPYAYPLTKPVKMIKGKYRYYPGGVSLVVGKPISCAVYRGDEMMIHGMRMWQTASNGPWKYEGANVVQDRNRLLVNSGSYNGRYLRMYKAIYSYLHGTEYKDKNDITGEDRIIVPDNGGKQIKIGLDEGANIASWAAMHCCNVISVAYDLTALKVKLAYETGTGENWKNAADNEYHLFDLKALVDLEVKE